ncbi:MAG: hypothetical protein JWM12_1567 [Ilumatobacteraceae bacterium]|nr:hypothetical protein [Ilumatobacteraceae bacterium]
MRRWLHALTDGLIAIVGALALRAMGVGWNVVAVLAVLAATLAFLLIERPRRHRPRPRGRHR